MTAFDEFDDDVTVVHRGPGHPGSAGPDRFDDDETSLATRMPDPASLMPHPGAPAHTPTPTPGPGQHQPSVSPGPVPAAAGANVDAWNGPGSQLSRSIDALQREAPMGPAWRPPDRPTSFEPVPYSPGRTRARARLLLVAVLVALAVAGAAIAVGVWLAFTGEAAEPGTGTVVLFLVGGTEP